MARRKIDRRGARRAHGERGGEHLQLLAQNWRPSPRTRSAAIPDRRLALMFACAHPAIDAGVRAPLMLQAVLGFDAAAIASAFLVSPAAMGQRLVRAKTKIRAGGHPLPRAGARRLPERLDAVLDAIYAAYAEGWSDAAGPTRAAHLAEEAIWLGRRWWHCCRTNPRRWACSR